MHGDHGSSALHAVYRHGAAHGVHNAFTDGHSKTASHDFTDSRIILSLKGFEELLLELPADSYARIADHKRQGRIPCRCTRAFRDFQFDSALPGRILHRIAEKIEQQLRHSQLVAEHVFGHGVCHLEGIFMSVRHDLRLHEIRDFLDQLPKVDPGLLQYHSAALDPAHIQYVIDQLQQMIAGRHDFLQTVPHLFRIVYVRRGNIGKSNDGVHRRADVVGHIGEEGALGVIRVPCLLQGCFEKPSLSEFFLPLFFNVGKSKQHLYGFARSDPDSLHLIVLRRTCIAGTEGKCESAFFVECFHRMMDIGLEKEIIPVLPGNALIGKRLDRICVAGRENAPVLVDDLVIAPVDLVGICIQIDQIYQLILLGKAHDQVHSPGIFNLDLLALRHIAQNDQAHNITGRLILGEDHDLSEPEPFSIFILDHVFCPELFLAHLIHSDEIFYAHQFFILLHIVGQNPLRPFGGMVGKCARDLRFLYVIKNITIQILDRDDLIPGHVDLKRSQ